MKRIQNEFLSVSGAARFLDIAAQTLRDWERKGWIRCIRTERGVRFFVKADVEKIARELRRRSA